MIQFDIYGNETEVKETHKKQKTVISPDEKELTPVAVVVEEKAPYYMTIEKRISLKPHQIVRVTTFNKFGSTQNEKSKENLKACDGQFNGYMSANTSRYVKRIVENWLTAIELNSDLHEVDYRNKPYVTFVTLTLPSKQVHHDNFLKEKCLDPMTKWLQDSTERTKRKGAGVDAYLWRAESQKNGNLHFHLICDRWIDHEKLRTKWNQIIERLGYVTAYKNTQNYIYKEGFRMRAEQAEKQKEALMYVVQSAIRDGKTIPDTKYRDFPQVRAVLNTIIKEYNLLGKKEQKQTFNYGLSDETAQMLVYKMQFGAYETGLETNWQYPNTTDIHKLNNLNSISAYITKYVSKKDFKEPILAKNQYIVIHPILGQRLVTVKEGGDKNQFMDWEDDFEFTYTFESRKVHGRIWGKSKNLSDVKTEEQKKTIEPPTFTTETKFIFEDPQFGRKHETFYENTNIIEYTEEVAKLIPEPEITRLAEIIKSDYCEVIPLGKYDHRINHKTKKREKYFKIEKQIHYLDKLSPEIRQSYLKHYSTIYSNIYGKTYTLNDN